LQRRGRGDNGGGWQQRGGRQDYQEIQKSNVLFEKYYNELEIIPSEEYEEFWATFRRDLPNSFRFTGSKGYVLQPTIKRFLKLTYKAMHLLFKGASSNTTYRRLRP
jgi:hypothetical protein